MIPQSATNYWIGKYTVVHVSVKGLQVWETVMWDRNRGNFSYSQITNVSVNF